MTYAFEDFTVTTWRRDDEGRQVWRARAGDRVEEFVAPRDADAAVLSVRGAQVLGLDPGPNADAIAEMFADQLLS